MGCVYFAQKAGTNEVKIGLSFRGAEQRVKSLAAQERADIVLLGTIEHPDARWLERAFHFAFSIHYLRGEWFLIEPYRIQIILDHQNELPQKTCRGFNKRLNDIGAIDWTEVNNNLPVFTDPKIPCPKCGEPVTRTYYKRHLKWNCKPSGVPYYVPRKRITGKSITQQPDAYQGA